MVEGAADVVEGAADVVEGAVDGVDGAVVVDGVIVDVVISISQLFPVNPVH